MNYNKLTRRLLATVSLGALTAFLGHPAAAATLTVINGADSGADSLRDAIGSSASGDSINLSPALNTTVTLGSDLTVGHSLTIDFKATSGQLFVAGAHGIAFTTGSSSLNAGGFMPYSGTTSLQSGTLSITGSTGWFATQSPLAMSGGTILNVGPSSNLGADFASLSGAGTINLSAGNTLELTGNDQTSTIFTGTIRGAGGITMLGGGGTLTLTNLLNNYSGTTNIIAGVIVGTPLVGLPFTATLAAGHGQCILDQFAG